MGIKKSILLGALSGIIWVVIFGGYYDKNINSFSIWFIKCLFTKNKC